MSALLDALDYAGSTLAKPGRAVRGLISGNANEGAAILPFSDSLGITDRANEVTGQGLLRQGGWSTGSTWGDALAGLGVEIATDPLTWFGAGIGNAVGRNLGKVAAASGPKYGTTIEDLWRMRPASSEGMQLGKFEKAIPGLPADNAYIDEFAGMMGGNVTPNTLARNQIAEAENMAEAINLGGNGQRLLTDSEAAYHGLRPGATAAEIPAVPSVFGPSPPPAWSNPAAPLTDHAAEIAASDRLRGHISAISNSPARDAILREIPPGSRTLGSGVEAIAFLTPTGDVVRVAPSVASATGRPVSETILQATRTAAMPAGAGTAMVERTPLASRVGDASLFRSRNPETMMTPMDVLRSEANAGGLNLWDAHLGNVGVAGNRPVIIDPGAVNTAGFRGAFQPVTQIAEPSAASNLLLRALGGDDAIRAAIEAGNTPSYTGRLTRLGAETGSAAGEGGRLIDRRSR